MAKLLSVVLVWVVSSVIARVVVSMGIAFFSYKAIYAAVESAVDFFQQFLSGLPSQILDLLTLMGADQALSIICSAIVTVAAIKSVQVFVGVSS